jgi:hypothetical protein
VEPGLPVGEYRIIVRDVPVDGFWSISIYNARGFFDADPTQRCSINQLTAEPTSDGSIVAHLGAVETAARTASTWWTGWDYTVRLYRPRPEILDGTWTFPEVEQVR